MFKLTKEDTGQIGFWYPDHEKTSLATFNTKAPYWPQLSYCLSIQTRTRAYLVKGKGLLLSKLPRTTAMRPLSR